MAGYRVDITRSAEKDLADLNRRDHKRVVARMQALAGDPRPHGCEKLSGEEKYRLRQGDYRIVYAIDDPQSIVTVVKVAHRRDAYR